MLVGGSNGIMRPPTRNHASTWVFLSMVAIILVISGVHITQPGPSPRAVQLPATDGANPQTGQALAERLESVINSATLASTAATGAASAVFRPVRTNHTHYTIRRSTIPNAGLGVFAKHDLPAGTIWNIEDAYHGNTITITRPQWDALYSLATSLQSSGLKTHALYDFIVLIRRYAYYCAEADFVIITLTHAILTNHAKSPRRASQTKSLSVSKSAGRHLLSMIPQEAAQQQLRANSAYAWKVGPGTSAEQAARLGVAAPSLRERCVLSRTLRDIKAGEEILEDYGTYDCPWPGCGWKTTPKEFKAQEDK